MLYFITSLFITTMMEVKFYESDKDGCPVYDYIKNDRVISDVIEKKKIALCIKKLETNPLSNLLHSKTVKQLKGYNNLYELRPIPYRILFVIKNMSYILLHIFRKKGDETPPKEIDIALKYMNNIK